MPTQITRDLRRTLSKMVLELFKSEPEFIYNNAFEFIKEKLIKEEYRYREFSKMSSEELTSYSKALSSPELNENRADYFKHIIDNLEAYKKETQVALRIMGYSIKKSKVNAEATLEELIELQEQYNGSTAIEEAEDKILEGETPINEKTKFDGTSSLQEDPRNKLSSELKAIFHLIPQVRNNILGMQTYYDFDTVYNALLELFAGENLSFEEMLTILEKNKNSSRPYIASVLTRLKKEDITDQFKYGLTSHFQNTYLEHEMVLWNENTNKFEVIKSNRGALATEITSRWVDNTVTGNSKVFKNEGGQVFVDEQFVENKFTDKWNEIRESNFDPNKVKEWLDMIGIKMPIAAIEELRNNSENLKIFKRTKWELLFEGNNHFAVIYKKIKGLRSSVDVSITANNPVADDGYVKDLAKLSSKHEDQINSSSFLNGEGKQIFSYVNPSWLFQRLRQIKNQDGTINYDVVEKLLSISYLKHSKWLQNLRKRTGKEKVGDQKFQEVFDVTLTDSIKQSGTDNEAVPFKDMSERERTVTLINLFINSTNQTSKFVVAKSDKELLHIVTATRHNVNTTQSNSYNKEDKDALMHLALAEYERYLKAQKLEDEGVNFKDIAGYEPKKFYHFPELNKETALLLYSNGRLKEIDDSIKESIWKIIHERIEKEVTETENRLKSIGIINPNGTLSKVDNNYKELHSDKANIGNFLARDFVINNMIATMNYEMIFQGDIATAGKTDSYGNPLVKETVANMFKRVAKDIAPSRKLGKLSNNDKFQRYNQIFLQDAFSGSLNIDQIKEIFDKEESGKAIIAAFEEITSTDSQEVTTLQEHIDVLYAMGKIKDKDYQELSKENSKREPYFNKKQLSLILQPMKPVYVGNQIMEQYDLDMPVYIKSSSFPLVPQLVKGTAFEVLERTMHKGNIQRAVFESGSKMGGFKIIDSWNKVKDKEGNEVSLNGNKLTDGTFNEEALNKAIKDKAYLTLNRSSFGIQQEIPSKDETHIKEGTQLAKLILAGLRGDKKAIDEFNNLHNDLVDIRFDNFKKEFGITTDENGDFKIIDASKFRQVLIDELEKRGDSNDNDIAALELDASGQFIIPLWASPKSAKFDPLLHNNFL